MPVFYRKFYTVKDSLEKKEYYLLWLQVVPSHPGLHVHAPFIWLQVTVFPATQLHVLPQLSPNLLVVHAERQNGYFDSVSQKHCLKYNFETWTGIFLYLLILFTENKKVFLKLCFSEIIKFHLDEEHYHNLTAVMGIIVISNTKRSYCTIIYIW